MIPRKKARADRDIQTGYYTTANLEITEHGPLPEPTTTTAYHIWTLIDADDKHIYDLDYTRHISGTAKWETRPRSKYLYCYVYKTIHTKQRKAYAGSQRTITPDRLSRALKTVNKLG